MKIVMLCIPKVASAHIILAELIGRGMKPAAVVFERERPLSERLKGMVRKKGMFAAAWHVLSRVPGRLVRPFRGPSPHKSNREKFERIVHEEEVTTRAFKNVNNNACRKYIAGFRPDVIVAGGRILKPETFAIPSKGTVNLHPGILPEFRGSDPVEWALLEDGPIGASVHLVDEGIDSGSILAKKEIAPEKGDTREVVYEKCYRAGAALLGDILADFDRYARDAVPQDPSAGKTYRHIKPRLRRKALKKLYSGSI